MSLPATSSLSLMLSLCASMAALAEPTRIMPLGDSITDNDAYSSYRRPLWKRLQQANRSVDFVGTRQGPFHNDFDYDHEGHAGWRIDYAEWFDAAGQQPQLPRRIEARRARATVRLIVDHWDFNAQ